jgi:ubiquinone/menaquinone biosynthesis C-methylase UbiE
MAYQTADSRKQFDHWSSHYNGDWLQLFFFEPAHRMVLKELHATDQRILDIGCGTGRLAAAILRRFPHLHVWGLELSDGMLRECLKLEEASGGRLHLVQGDSERLPFASDTFDAITCTHCFHHFPHQDRVVAEMYRVLRPGGRLLIIDGDRDRWWGRLLFDVLVVLVEGPVRHLTGQAFRELYQASGFEDISQRRRRGPLPFLLTRGLAVKPRRSEQREYRLSA